MKVNRSVRNLREDRDWFTKKSQAKRDKQLEKVQELKLQKYRENQGIEKQLKIEYESRVKKLQLLGEDQQLEIKEKAIKDYCTRKEARDRKLTL